MWLILDFLGFSFVAIIMLGFSSHEMPNKIDKKTGKKRSFYQRWKLANWQLRWQLIAGILAAFVSAWALLQLLGILPRIEL